MSEFVHGQVTQVRMPRTRFPVNHSNITTTKCGYLYPIYLQEIYPCDSFDISANWVARSIVPFYRPVMDNLYVDFAYFFVPSRICYDNWEKIFGEGNPNTWYENEDYEAPSTVDVSRVYSRSVADYMGLPPNRTPKGINVIPYRAFALIYNHWYRDQNLIDETYVERGEYNSEVEVFNGDPWSPANYMGLPPKVAKFHDYFTGALPEPQRGEAVEVPLGGGVVPVRTIAKLDTGLSTEPLKMRTTDPNAMVGGYLNPIGLNVPNHTPSLADRYRVQTGTADTIGEYSGDYNDGVYPTNLGADLSSIGVVTVNTLRLAFQTQKILERTARGGARYREYIRSAFGCVTSDARMQIPEFLGGKRMPLNIQQATSTQGDTLGDVGGWSLSNGRNGFNKGFTEHGFVIGVMCIRQKHTYSQGIERFWSRKSRWDYYDPTLAHIGEQPIYVSEICSPTQDNLKGDIFGYREAFSDLRYRPNVVTGQARPQQNASNYYYYTFADDYELVSSPVPGQDTLIGAPVLGEEFINETDENVRRSMSGMTEDDDQFIFDINFSGSAVRVLPAHGTPSLIDHF